MTYKHKFINVSDRRLNIRPKVNRTLANISKWRGFLCAMFVRMLLDHAIVDQISNILYLDSLNIRLTRGQCFLLQSRWHHSKDRGALVRDM